MLMNAETCQGNQELSGQAPACASCLRLTTTCKVAEHHLGKALPNPSCCEHHCREYVLPPTKAMQYALLIENARIQRVPHLQQTPTPPPRESSPARRHLSPRRSRQQLPHRPKLLAPLLCLCAAVACRPHRSQSPDPILPPPQWLPFSLKVAVGASPRKPECRWSITQLR